MGTDPLDRARAAAAAATRRMFDHAYPGDPEPGKENGEDPAPGVKPAGGKARRKRRGAKTPAATRLVQLATDAQVELWHTADQTAYATLAIDGHREHWPLRGGAFPRWLRRRFYLAEHSSPPAQALQDALGVLEGQATFEGKEHPVHVRLAEHEGRVYLDLADPAWRAVEVDAKGWRVVKEPPVRIRRPRGLLALPEPARRGSLDELRRFVNLPAGDGGDARDAPWRLLVGWLAAALRPRGLTRCWS